jgi:hypothetical protein
MTVPAKGTFQNGQIAQLVERSPEKAGVGGSIPSLATILLNHLAATRNIGFQFREQ